MLGVGGVGELHAGQKARDGDVAEGVTVRAQEPSHRAARAAVEHGTAQDNGVVVSDTARAAGQEHVNVETTVLQDVPDQVSDLAGRARLRRIRDQYRAHGESPSLVPLLARFDSQARSQGHGSSSSPRFSPAPAGHQPGRQTAASFLPSIAMMVVGLVIEARATGCSPWRGSSRSSSSRWARPGRSS